MSQRHIRLAHGLREERILNTKARPTPMRKATCKLASTRYRKSPNDAGGPK